MANSYLVIDCESVGLYGETFAVGYVLIDRKGNRLNEGLIAAPSDNAFGASQSHTWVEENVAISWEQMRLEGVSTFNMGSVAEVRQIFWDVWMKARTSGAAIAADCLFPVEALFVAEAVKQNVANRQWSAPYPFIEISTLLFACGKDPIGNYNRRMDELPRHNPLADARQSARIMIECLDHLGIL